MAYVGLSEDKDKTDRRVSGLCAFPCDVPFVSCHLEEFCHSATFLDLSLSFLTAGRLLPPPPPTFTRLVPPSFPLLLQHVDWGSHFHVSGTPVSVTAPCLPVSLEAASLVWEAAGEAIGIQLSPTQEL